MNEAFQTEEKEEFDVQIIETSKQWFRNVSNSELKLEILWAMLTKWYPPLPHVLYGKVLVLLWETPKAFEKKP